MSVFSNKQSALSISRPTSFLLKGALLPMSILELRSANFSLIAEELSKKVQVAPTFFKGSPVVFSFEYLENFDAIKLSALHCLCQELGLLSAGIKGGTETQKHDAQKLGLAVFPKSRAKNEQAFSTTANSQVEPKQLEPDDSAPNETSLNETPSHTPSKIIETPIRSGQQVYAPGDLVILSSVSAGAEILSERNIHIYGALRGRALAGVKGLESARIYCLKQEAELISIAGHFMFDEDLRSVHWGESVQAFYDGKELQMKKFND